MYSERLKEKIDNIRNALKAVLADFGAHLDYPDEVEEDGVRERAQEAISAAEREISALLASYFTGRKLAGGVKVGIVGRPNTGKSSLLNALLSYEKAIVSAVAGRTDVILCDKENHASIYDGCRLSFAKMVRYNHSDMEDLENKLKAIDPAVSGALIVTDGVFSMSGEICKLPEIVALAKKYGAGVMVDDAHGLGVLGEGGRGTASHFGLEDEVDIYMGTFSKSLASLGGYMAANRKICEYVRHTSRPFIFSASMTPASVACARASLAVLKAEPERVKRLAEVSEYMRGELKKRGVKIVESATPIIPIYTYEDETTFRACKMLFERGVYVNPVVSPATPVGQSLLRTSYTATHTFAQLGEAAEKIRCVLGELGVM